MKRLLCLLIAAVACVSLSFALAQEPAVPKKVEPNPKTVPPGWQDGPGPVQPPLVGRRRGLTLRQAWSLGIRPANVLRAHAKLTAEGVITDESSEAEVVSAIGSSLKASNEKAFAEFQGAVSTEATTAEAAALDSKWLAILEAIYNLLKLLGIL